MKKGWLLAAALLLAAAAQGAGPELPGARSKPVCERLAGRLPNVSPDGGEAAG